ncbi:Gfo/Idh/MocA family oxidoreductase [Candidatus Atribacteria bacterium 1244-E10-H5-B2]|nr:MAG: Gfo/Idh/MocA family oxidoreductase [Candidatus Atribacteria bacterium 1244-E10-H5-B2]
MLFQLNVLRHQQYALSEFFLFSYHFVDILTPPFVHSSYCLSARERNLHVICQKPIAGHIEEARSLVRNFKNYERLFAIHENHRYRPWFKVVQQKLQEGFFGRPHFVRFEQLNPSEPGVAYKLEMDPGVLLEHGTHLVDMAHALFGKPLRTYSRFHHINLNITGESLAHVLYEYPETTVVINVSWKPGGVRQASFLLSGESGEAYYEGSMVRGESSRFRLVRGKEVVLDETREPNQDYADSFYLFQRECTDAMLAGLTNVTQSAEKNLLSLESTFKSYKAGWRGQIVDI